MLLISVMPLVFIFLLSPCKTGAILKMFERELVPIYCVWSSFSSDNWLCPTKITFLGAPIWPSGHLFLALGELSTSVFQYSSLFGECWQLKQTYEKWNFTFFFVCFLFLSRLIFFPCISIFRNLFWFFILPFKMTSAQILLSLSPSAPFDDWE